MAIPFPRKEAVGGLDTLRFAFEPLPDQPTDTSQTVLPKLSSFVGPDTPRFAFEPPPDQPTDTSQNVLPDPISDFWIPPNVECVRATNLALVRRRILKIQKAVEQNPRLSTQYLLILDADNAQREKLFAKRMSGVRATFDDSKILLRIMPGVSHDSLIGLFSVHLVTAMAMVGIPSGSDSWIPTGTTRRRGHYCGKEPDYSMVPIANTPLALQTTPLKNNVWPSFVVEAGYSESLSQLRKDARWWWRNSDRETKVILLFDIRRSPSYSVHVEVWEEVFRQPTGVITQSVAAYQIQFQDTVPYLECTYSADVNTSASHTPIHLNSSYLMRQGSAASIQPPITLSPAMLTDICKQLA